MVEAFHVVPVSASKVGEGYSCTSVVHRDSSQFGQCTPFSQVVYVHIQWQTVLQTVYHTAVHDEVHTTVSTYFFCHFTVFLQDRMLVFVDQCFHFFFRKEWVRTQVVYFRLYARSFHLISVYGIAFYRIFISESFCSCQLIQTVVRLRIHYVVLDFDYFTVFCTDKCSSVVTVTEFIARFAGCFFYQCFSVYGFCIHCYQGSHTVTTVNI